MSQASFVISKLLITEAVGGDNDCDGWNTIIDTYVLDLLKLRRMELLSAPTRLAIAISIVGSRRLDLFTTAFRLLCDWDHIGGPYWLVQEELLRFAAIHLFQCEMKVGNADKSMTTSNIRKQLPDVLPNDLPHYVTHKILRKRIHFLRTEFEWLLDDIRRASKNDTEAVLLEYTDRFPLDLFVDWFLDWAQSLLVKFGESTLHNATSSRSSVESACRMNMLGSPQPERDSLAVSSSTARRQHYLPLQSKTNSASRDHDDLHVKTQFSSRKNRENCDVNANILENGHKHYASSKSGWSESTIHDRDNEKLKAKYQLKSSFEEDTHNDSNHDALQLHGCEDILLVAENTKKRNFHHSHVEMRTAEKRRKTISSVPDSNLKIIIPASNPSKSTGMIKENSKQIQKRNPIAVTIEKKRVKKERLSSNDDDANEDEDFPRNLEGHLELERSEHLSEKESVMEQSTDTTVLDDRTSDCGGSNVKRKEEVGGVRVDKGIPMSMRHNRDEEERIYPASDIQHKAEHQEADSTMLQDARLLDDEEIVYRKFLSPLTPHSGSGSGSSLTAPQMEPSFESIGEERDIEDTDDVTEYYESASECENEENGFLTTIAKSVWGIFSPNCH